ncbi:hypothetical protein H0H93_001424 [Arthromyces matolae]|nr:hypothetical protein H0H93_001424 [Arthromyces matolae]
MATGIWGTSHRFYFPVLPHTNYPYSRQPVDGRHRARPVTVSPPRSTVKTRRLYGRARIRFSQLTPLPLDFTIATRISAMSPTLPVETIYQITDHLGNDRNTLLACSLAASVFLSSARRHLFHELKLECSAICDFMRLIDVPWCTLPTAISRVIIGDKNRRDASYLKKVYTPMDRSRLVSRLQTIHSVKFQNVSLENIPVPFWRILHQLEGVHELEIHQMSFESPVHFFRYICALPALNALSISRSCIQVTATDMEPLRPKVPFCIPFLDVGRLSPGLLDWFLKQDPIPPVHTFRINLGSESAKAATLRHFMEAMGKSVQNLQVTLPADVHAYDQTASSINFSSFRNVRSIYIEGYLRLGEQPHSRLFEELTRSILTQASSALLEKISLYYSLHIDETTMFFGVPDNTLLDLFEWGALPGTLDEHCHQNLQSLTLSIRGFPLYQRRRGAEDSLRKDSRETGTMSWGFASLLNATIANALSCAACASNEVIIGFRIDLFTHFHVRSNQPFKRLCLCSLTFRMSFSPPIRRLSTASSSSKEDLINAYEAEEERIINVLSRKLEKLREEKIDLENALEAESESHVNRLARELTALRMAQNGHSAPSSSVSASPETGLGMRSVMNGGLLHEPNVETMLDAMRIENEQLRNKLVDTERDYIRISRLNEIYREELIEHRRHLGLSVDNLIGLSSPDPYSQPTHRRPSSSSFTNGSTSAASVPLYQAQAAAAQPIHGVPIPQVWSRIHRPVNLASEGNTPLSHSPSSSESPFPFSPATNPGSFTSPNTNITTPPSSISFNSNAGTGASFNPRTLTYPSVPPPSLSSSFGSPTAAFSQGDYSPVEPSSRRNSGTRRGSDWRLSESNSRRNSVERGARVAETGTLIPRSRAGSFAPTSPDIIKENDTHCVLRKISA